MAIISAIASIFTRDYISFILIIQFLIGAWQYLGCLIFYVLGYRSEPKKQYLILSSLYLGLLFVAVAIFKPSGQLWYHVLLTVPPWALAVFYIVITYKITFPKKHSRFLSHLSF